MKTRQELKAAAKETFKRNYWPSVVAGVILGLTTAGTVVAVGTDPGVAKEIDALISNVTPGVALALLGAVFTGSILMTLLFKLIKLALEVGCKRFFVKNREDNANVKECFSGYTRNLGNTFVTLLVRDIKVALWSLLFLVPGIVKAYEYKMVAYLLAEDPEMDRKEAFRTSKEMMRGHKMDAFLLDLSFLGWTILTKLTFGLAGIFYVNPYKESTNVEFFEAVKVA